MRPSKNQSKRRRNQDLIRLASVTIWLFERLKLLVPASHSCSALHIVVSEFSTYSNRFHIIRVWQGMSSAQITCRSSFHLPFWSACSQRTAWSSSKERMCRSHRYEQKHSSLSIMACLLGVASQCEDATTAEEPSSPSLIWKLFSCIIYIDDIQTIKIISVAV
jgi:hypothetical protein